VELDKLIKAAEIGAKSNLEIRIGGGLDSRNVFPLIKIEQVAEFVIGHAIIAQGLMNGLTKAVEDMITIVKWS